MNWTNNKAELLSIPLPENTRTYGVIPHSVLLQEVEEQLDKQGFQIERQEFMSASKGQIVTANYQISSPTFDLDLELKPNITLVNSYNKMRKASVSGGVKILICANGMIGNSGGNYSRKHMGDNSLKDFRSHVQLVISGLEGEYTKLKQNVVDLKLIELDKKQRAQLVGDMFVNEGLITSTQLGILKREISFSEHFKGVSAWDFYNHVTEAYKSSHPMFYDKQHMKFHAYMQSKFELDGDRKLYKGTIDDITPDTDAGRIAEDDYALEEVDVLGAMEAKFADAML